MIEVLINQNAPIRKGEKGLTQESKRKNITFVFQDGFVWTFWHEFVKVK